MINNHSLKDGDNVTNVLVFFKSYNCAENFLNFVDKKFGKLSNDTIELYFCKLSQYNEKHDVKSFLSLFICQCWSFVDYLNHIFLAHSNFFKSVLFSKFINFIICKFKMKLWVLFNLAIFQKVNTDI